MEQVNETPPYLCHAAHHTFQMNTAANELEAPINERALTKRIMFFVQETWVKVAPSFRFFPFVCLLLHLTSPMWQREKKLVNLR
ncbi:hypothetical protein AVEN_229594-1 [Araneus ventricosus]|uniref:Uncharacterized protein n=1 Tax=Araneus ventricosus TaxID=182803 RepID=A0A4Y2DC10_ARAVE|nr:hypothetical protein AVEN_229594-1 [Araneus ventricosus]